jgi:hypothetical protein
MTQAMIDGLGTGALHAVTGPDHVLSLGPLALRVPRAGRIGALWGLGRALGTLLLAVPALVVARSLDLTTLSLVGERIAGVALLVSAARSWRALHRPITPATTMTTNDRGPVVTGVVHGVTGAAALLVTLPVFVNGPVSRAVVALVGFGAGGVVAMALLTTALSLVCRGLAGSRVRRVQRACVVASGVLGVAWLV